MNVEESHVDDVSGDFLDPEMVREARVEELAGEQVYCRVPVAEVGSHEVIKTRWVDTDKGDERSPEIRCRFGCEGGEETQQHRGGEREFLRIHSTS